MPRKGPPNRGKDPFAPLYPRKRILQSPHALPDPHTGVVPEVRDDFEMPPGDGGDELTAAMVAGLQAGAEVGVSLFQGLVHEGVTPKRALEILAHPEVLEEMARLAANPALDGDPVRLDVDWETPTRELLGRVHGRLAKKGLPLVISRSLFHPKEVHYAEFLDREHPPESPLRYFLRFLPRNAGALAASSDMADLQAFAGVRELAVFLEQALMSPRGLWPEMNIVALRSRMRKGKAVVCATVKSDGVQFRTVQLDPRLTNWFVLRREEEVMTG